MLQLYLDCRISIFVGVFFPYLSVLFFFVFYIGHIFFVNRKKEMFKGKTQQWGAIVDFEQGSAVSEKD